MCLLKWEQSDTKSEEEKRGETLNEEDIEAAEFENDFQHLTTLSKQ